MNVSNSQDTRITFENVLIRAPSAQKVINIANSRIVANRVTSEGPLWENAGTIEFADSRINGSVTNLSGGTSQGSTTGTGAGTAEFKIPPCPVPHKAAGKFTTLGK